MTKDEFIQITQNGNQEEFKTMFATPELMWNNLISKIMRYIPATKTTNCTNCGSYMFIEKDGESGT